MFLQSSKRGVGIWQQTTVMSLQSRMLARIWVRLSERQFSHISEGTACYQHDSSAFLGDTVDYDATTNIFLDKCVEAISRGNVTDVVYQMIGLISRSFTCFTADIFISLYKPLCANTSSVGSQS